MLKVALDEQKAARLHAEVTALDLVGGGVVVRLLGGPRELGGRTVLDLEYAGGRSLGARLRAEGKLTYHELARFGGDLFTALDQLAAKGVRHRDLKPDNFGVFQRADRSWQLMLFDFSLAGISERDITAGTRGYLDPFLGTDRRPVFDDHAERYAAAVTLHEMASTEKPVWGDGMTDPRTTADETPTVSAELFDPALREGLTGFFQRALHRDVDRRFDTFRQMEEAWRAVFAAADAAAPATTPATIGADSATLEEKRDAAAGAAELDTPLEAAGLSPRAVSVAQTFGATTVGELLDVRLHQIAKARGAGATIRKELNRRHKQWAATLGRPKQVPPTPSARTSTPGEAPGHGGGPERDATAWLTIDEMAARLTPSPASSRGSKKSDVVCLTLGLRQPGEGVESAPSWSIQGAIAQRLGITQASVSRHHQAAIKEWAAEQWLAGIRDELVSLVDTAGRVMTAEELAVALRVHHGVAEDEPQDRVMTKASAVVRAAVEAETWPESRESPETEPRLAVRRRGQAVLIVLESLPGTDDPSAPELADYAFALGRQAEELAFWDPLPGRAVVLRELRAVTTPEGLAALADTRLVALAAAVSQQVAASPRLELYPRTLDLTRALRISQAAAGVRRDAGITMDELLARVRARFPDLPIDPRVTHVQVEDALKAAGFALEYQPVEKKFLPPPEPGRVPRSVSTAMSGHGRMVAAGLDPHAVTAQKLATTVERGGFLALPLRGKHLPGTAQSLTEAYGVRPVDLNREFLAEFRALAAERGQDWGKVLTIDARFAATGQISPGLASYLRAVWTRVEQRMLRLAAEPNTVLFVHDAGLLARYYDQGGHELLTRLQNAARRPSAAPHGFWLLCPAESALDTPNLDGHIVEIFDDTERVVLSRDFLAGLRGEPGTAA